MEDININRLPITPEALRWRDLPTNETRGELILRISMVILAILIGTATVIGCYYLANMTQVIRGDVYKLDAPVAILGAFGGIVTLVLGMLGLSVNFENAVHKPSDNRIKELLTESPLSELCTEYRCHSIKNLVNTGYLSTEDGAGLRDLRKKYYLLKYIKDSFENSPHIKAQIDLGCYPKEYAVAVLELHQLEVRWRQIQNTVRIRSHINILPDLPILPVYTEIDYKLLNPTREARRWRNLEFCGENESLNKYDILSRCFLLTKGSLENVYSHYCRSNGGLRAALRHGLLEVEQARSLQFLFQKRTQLLKNREIYTNDVNKQQLQSYQVLTDQIQNLEEKWKKLSGEIEKSLMVAKEENQVKKDENIELFNKLPKTALHHIFSFLNLQELSQLAQAKKQLNQHVKEEIKLRVNRDYCANAENLEEACAYMRSLVKGRRYLVDKGILTREDLLGEQLLSACEKQDFEKAGRLVEMGAYLELRNKKGETPLFLALKHGNHSIAEKLLEKGADSSALTHKNKTVLSQALYHGFHDIVKMIG